ncbi:MAG: hypothetical protein P1U89_24815 [Verrucomicrobiales bacterium]|nr:hypothetical protein [Verrucomicrobiales bacterium]
MRNLILTALIVTFAMLMGPVNLNASTHSCVKKKVCTEEVCRREFCKTKTVCGCVTKTLFVEITYKTTYRDSCGNCSYRIHTETRRCN